MMICIHEPSEVPVLDLIADMSSKNWLPSIFFFIIIIFIINIYLHYNFLILQ